MFTATKVIADASRIADLQETQFVTYADKLSFINEGWRNLYSRYTESEGDYWVSDYVFNVTPANQEPNSNGVSYLIDLPSDFYKIRSLSWNTSTRWMPVMKFSISQRDNYPSRPMYRLKNNKLWVVCPQGILPQFKMEYYTPPQDITLPEDSKDFCSDVLPYNIPNVTSLFYIANDILLYVLNSNSIVVEDLSQQTVTTLYTHTNPINNLLYFNGYVYFIDSVTSDLYRHTTDLVTPFTGPTVIVALVSNALIQSNYLYYSTASATFMANTDGTNSTNVLASFSKRYQMYDGYPVYINNSGFIVYNGVVSSITSERITQYNGTLYSFNLTNSAIYEIKADTTTFALSVGDTLSSNVTYMGLNVESSFIPTKITSAVRTTVQAISLITDYVFDYPSNEVNEIMSYYCAYCFVRKNSDQVKMAAIDDTLHNPDKGLWARFWSVNKRDEYQFTQINNDYQYDNNYWY